jgi:hypothetical protein
MMIIIASVAVALVAFILYALDRRSKEQPIEWEQAGKVSLMSGLITSGVVFATTADPSTVTEGVKTATEAVETVQDMFVGTPSF